MQPYCVVFVVGGIVAKKQHWLMEISGEVKARMGEISLSAADNLVDSVPFGTPVPEPKLMTLQSYLQAPPELRQAFLQAIPVAEFSATMGALQEEAVSKFGAMASAIMPLLTMEQQQVEMGHLGNQDPTAGIVAAHAEMQEMLYGPQAV